MSDVKIEGYELKPGFKGMATDTGSDQTMFKGVQWGKVMMPVHERPPPAHPRPGARPAGPATRPGAAGRGWHRPAQR